MIRSPVCPPRVDLPWFDVLDGAPDAIFLTDADFVIVWVNQKAGAVLLSAPADLVGRTIDSLFYDPREKIDKPISRDALLRQKTETFTVRSFRASDGTRVDLEVSARRIDDNLVMAVARDATKRLNDEALLARSEARFRALTESSPDGIVVHQRGRVVYANPGAARMLGYARPDEIVGRAVIDFVHADDQPKARARIRSMNERESAAPFTDERLIRSDGSLIEVSLGAVSIGFEGELSIVVIARDVTEQRMFEAQLIQAERMASLGVLAAGVAHEINNPLTYVILRLEVLASFRRQFQGGLRGLEDELAQLLGAEEATLLLDQHLRHNLDDLESHLSAASEGAQRVRRIVSDLRAFSRAQDDVVEPVDVRVPLDLAANMALHELKHHATLIKEYGSVRHVKANEGRLAQVFLNLILNAAQAIQSIGAPSDRPSEAERTSSPFDRQVRIATFEVDDQIFISVEDNGIGIPEEHLAKLFEPFFTTKPVGVGSGLGLAICHGIVSALGGTIRVESKLATPSTQGSTKFTVVLPASDDLLTSRPSPPSTNPASRRGRILVIDDEAQITSSLAIVLTPFGEVVSVNSGESAKALLSTDEAFDVIVCDVVMPGMTGIELHASLLRETPHLAGRMLFMTGGRADDLSRVFAETMGNRWLEKPVDLDALTARVGSMLRRCRAVDVEPL